MYGYGHEKLHEHKVMKLVINIHEIIDYIDDGHHNEEIKKLVDVSNMLLNDLEKREDLA